MCCGRSCALSAAVLAVVAAAAVPLVGRLFRAEYPVHQSGCILITGASTGIGRSAALALAGLGYEVYAGVRKEADVEALRQAAGGLSGRLHGIILDVTKTAEVDDAVKAVQGCGMPFVGLVNNAGLSLRRPMETVPMEVVKQTFDVNVFGLLDLTQKLIPLLRSSSGRIVNVGSVAGIIAMRGQGIYAATKYALEAISDALRLELAPWAISVSMVNPGYVTTDLRTKVKAQLQQPTATEQELYGGLIAHLQAKEVKLVEFGSPCCNCTDDAIVHALIDPHPLTRYFPGVVAPEVPSLFLVPLVKILSLHPYLERLGDMLKAGV